MNDYDWCPVCRRLVAVSNVQRIVMRHYDKVGGSCPMSGVSYPLHDFEVSA